MFFEDLADVTIDLAGSELYMRNSRLGGFQFRYSQRITLTNFTVDYLDRRTPTRR